MKGSYWNAERGSRNIEPGTGPQSSNLSALPVMVQPIQTDRTERDEPLTTGTGKASAKTHWLSFLLVLFLCLYLDKHLFTLIFTITILIVPVKILIIKMENFVYSIYKT